MSKLNDWSRAVAVHEKDDVHEGNCTCMNAYDERCMYVLMLQNE